MPRHGSWGQRHWGEVVGRGDPLCKERVGDRWLLGGVEEHAKLLREWKKGTEVAWERTNRPEGVFIWNREIKQWMQWELPKQNLNKNWIAQETPVFEMDHSGNWIGNHIWTQTWARTDQGQNAVPTILTPNIMTLGWHPRKKLFRVDCVGNQIGEFCKDWA